MTTHTSPAAARFELPASAPAAARAVLRLLQGLRHGTLDVQFPDGSQARFGHGAEPRAAMRLHDWQVCGAALKSGDIGFAESWIAGHWSTPDLVALLKLFIANRDAVEQVIYGTWWGSLAYRIKHLLNRNSRQGSRKNIHAHYDIGNPFYRLWLDETMNYSSALFGGNLALPLPDAQKAKVRRALDECGLQPGQRLLEIGCGWGALAEMAAVDFGARVTGVTLSTEQLEYAQQRLAGAGAAAQADLRLQDYRDIRDEPFDAICSIEMFEAVGREYWAVHLPGRPAAQPQRVQGAGAEGRPGGDDRAVLRRRLRRDAAPLARGLPGQGRAAAPARLRHAIHAHLGVLPGLLRGGLRHRQHRRRAVHAGEPGGPWAQGPAAPPEVAAALPGAQLQGSGRLRFIGLAVYDARLWRGAAPVGADWMSAPLALELIYLRKLVGRQIAERSIKEMRRQRELSDDEAGRWLAAMMQIFPDVKDGDRITGFVVPGLGARFAVNGAVKGDVRDTEFARLFFGIWLSDKSSEPALRRALLGQP